MTETQTVRASMTGSLNGTQSLLKITWATRVYHYLVATWETLPNKNRYNPRTNE